MTYHDISSPIMRYHDIPWHITTNNEISRHIMAYQDISFHIMIFMKYHDISWHTMTYQDISWHIMTWLLAERDSWQNMPISYLYVATNVDWWFTIKFMISQHYQLSMKITRLIWPWHKNCIYFRPEDGAASASGRKWQGSFRIIHLPLLFKTFTFLKMAIVSQIDHDDNILINVHDLSRTRFSKQ